MGVANVGVGAEIPPVLHQAQQVFAALHAKINADILPFEAIYGITGVFDGFPDRLKHQFLLRIHLRRLQRRNAEKQGVEPIRLVEEAAVAAVSQIAECLRVAINSLPVPAVSRHVLECAFP